MKFRKQVSNVWTNDVRNLMLWKSTPMSLFGPCLLICDSYEVTERWSKTSAVK